MIALTDNFQKERWKAGAAQMKKLSVSHASISQTVTLHLRRRQKARTSDSKRALTPRVCCVEWRWGTELARMFILRTIKSNTS